MEGGPEEEEEEAKRVEVSGEERPITSNLKYFQGLTDSLLDNDDDDDDDDVDGGV